MVGFKHTVCALLLTMITGMAIAQNNTNSPYTRYGLGDLSNQTFGNSKAMGGIAIGLRDGAQINPSNPASYTAIDSLTFLFEGGVSLQNMNISNGGIKLNAKNASFDYLAMQYRLAPWAAMTVGLLPFSNVGYSVSDSKTTTDSQTGNELTYARSFSGDGGMHQLFGGLGFKIIKNLSVGVNVSYYWGDINRSRSIFYSSDSYNSYRRDIDLSVSDFKVDFGAQYTYNLDKKNSFTLGVIYTPKHKLNSDLSSTIIMGGNTGSSSTSSYVTSLDAKLEMPNVFGIGATYKFDKRLTVGLDYSLQQWDQTKQSINTTDENVRQDFEETFAYCNRSKIAVGAEYIPNLLGRSYLSHVKYRAGAYYSTPYYKINGAKASREFGITAGVGLPMPRSRSIISLSGQFVHVKGLETNMVSENIFRVSIGITLNEKWFFKRRVE